MDWRYLLLVAAVVLSIYLFYSMYRSKTNPIEPMAIQKDKDSQELLSSNKTDEEKNEKNAKFSLEILDRELTKNPSWVAAVKELEYVSEGKPTTPYNEKKKDVDLAPEKKTKQFSKIHNDKIVRLLNKDSESRVDKNV
jgi:hypothetical protein